MTGKPFEVSGVTAGMNAQPVTTPSLVYDNTDCRIWHDEDRLYMERHGCALRPLGKPNQLTVITHLDGALLCHSEHSDTPLSGDLSQLIECGVIDRRSKWAKVIAQFSLAMEEGGPIPFLTADDPHDLAEAETAVLRHFGRIDENGEYRNKVAISKISQWHDHKYEHQMDGRFDVMWGLSAHGGFGEPGMGSGEKCLQYKQARCVLISDVQNLCIPGDSVPSGRDGAASANFVYALDDAIDLLNELGLCCVISGSNAAWWALRMAHGAPYRHNSRHSFLNIHIDRGEDMDQDLLRGIREQFEPCGKIDIDVCKHIYKVACQDKGGALLLAEHIAIWWTDSEHMVTAISVSDVERFLGQSILIAPQLPG